MSQGFPHTPATKRIQVVIVPWLEAGAAALGEVGEEEEEEEEDGAGDANAWTVLRLGYRPMVGRCRVTVFV